MESIFTSFGIPTEELRTVLNAVGGVVAGSAVLASVTGNFTPNDVDIWVYTDRGDDEPSMFIRRASTLLMRYFMLSHGYEERERNPAATIKKEGYSEGRLKTMVRKIQHFQKKDGKTIQVIHTKQPLTEVIKSFDISICQTWWSPKDNKVHSIYPNDILTKSFYFNGTDLPTAREVERIEKYKNRMFTYKTIERVV
jgi:hypothetical protein